jgi:hypothetical protein
MVEPSEEIPSRLVSGIVLPEDPNIEELARDWTLSEADIREVLFCRGTDNCLRFAVQLCVLGCHGRFLEEHDDSPVRIVNHLAAELHLAFSAFQRLRLLSNRPQPSHKFQRNCPSDRHLPLPYETRSS